MPLVEIRVEWFAFPVVDWMAVDIINKLYKELVCIMKIRIMFAWQT